MPVEFINFGIIIGENSRNYLSLDEYVEHFLVPFSPRFRNIDFSVSSLTSIGVKDIAVFARHDKEIILNYLAVGWPNISFHVFDYIDIKEKFALFMDEYLKEHALEYIAIIKGNYPVWFDMKDMLSAIGREQTVAAVADYNKDSIYTSLIIDRKNLIRKVEDIFSEESLDMDIILKIIKELGVHTVKAGGYIAPFRSLKEYYDIHISMISNYTEFDKFNSILPVKGDISMNIKSNFARHSHIINSIAGENIEINGKVENSIIFSDVKIGRNAHIKNSLILPGNHIGSNAVIINSIIDEFSGDNTRPNIENNAVIGSERQRAKNEKYPEILNFGVSLIGKDAHVYPGSKIGSNCYVECFVPSTLMRSYKKLADGMSIVCTKEDQ